VSDPTIEQARQRISDGDCVGCGIDLRCRSQVPKHQLAGVCSEDCLITRERVLARAKQERAESAQRGM
jgi:ferredoxin